MHPPPSTLIILKLLFWSKGLRKVCHRRLNFVEDCENSWGLKGTARENMKVLVLGELSQPRDERSKENQSFAEVGMLSNSISSLLTRHLNY